MTPLRKIDAALTAICAALAVWSLHTRDSMMLLMWVASAFFCAASCVFSWADRMYAWLKPAFVRIALVSAMRQRR